MADLKLKYAYGNDIGVDGISYAIMSFNSLASGSYSSFSGTLSSNNLETNCIDYLAEINVPNITGLSGTSFVQLFATTSLDATNYSDSQNTNPNALKLVGMLSLAGTGPWRSAAMSIAQAFNGFLPPYFKLVVLNSAGKTTSAVSNVVRLIGVKNQYV